MPHDNFKDKAKDWDKNSNANTKTIGEAILEKITLNNEMELLDFGTGTGLLGFEIARHVRKVYGVDTSRSMLDELCSKNTPELSIEPLLQDIIASPLKRSFDGLVSSMTLHHIENLERFFPQFTQIYKRADLSPLQTLSLKMEVFTPITRAFFTMVLIPLSFVK